MLKGENTSLSCLRQKTECTCGQRRICGYSCALRALRALTLSKDAGSQDASQLLIRIAVVLALLLAMLDVDRHSARLRSLGLMCDTYSADPISVPA